ncbi:unnamed protein product [Chrysoparadoxa australica]
MSRRRKAESISSRLKSRIEDGDYYEAAQLYKSSAARLNAQGKAQQSMELVTEGAVAMAKKEKLNAATELGLLLVESLEKEDQVITEESGHLLVSIAEAYPHACVEQVSFLKAAVRWSGPSLLPSMLRLRLLLARGLLATNEPGLAARQFGASVALEGKVASSNGDDGTANKSSTDVSANETGDFINEYADMIKAWSKQGYGSERDLFLCRAVLHLLALKSPGPAAALWAKVCPAEGHAHSDLCTFTWLLLQLALHGPQPPTEEAMKAFMMLKDHPACMQALSRDPELQSFVITCGEALSRTESK